MAFAYYQYRQRQDLDENQKEYLLSVFRNNTETGVDKVLLL